MSAVEKNRLVGMLTASGMGGSWVEQTADGKFIHCFEPNRGSRSVGPWPDVYRREATDEEVARAEAEAASWEKK
jgi:hypothetical protein